MIMSIEEFKRIRPVKWSLKTIGYKTYQTVNNQTDTQLFWIDFLRLVFIQKFRAQKGLTELQNIDITQPILIDPETLDIQLPDQMETVAYFANNQEPLKVLFNVNIPQIITLIVSIILFILLGILHYKRPSAYSYII